RGARGRGALRRSGALLPPARGRAVRAGALREGPRGRAARARDPPRPGGGARPDRTRARAPGRPRARRGARGRGAGDRPRGLPAAARGGRRDLRRAGAREPRRAARGGAAPAVGVAGGGGAAAAARAAHRRGSAALARPAGPVRGARPAARGRGRGVHGTGRDLPVSPQPAARVRRPRRAEARGAHHGAARGRPPAGARRGRSRALGAGLNARTTLLPVALAAALAVTALWWQLAEHRARVAEARLVKASERIAALADSLRAGHRAAPAAGAIPASDLERLRRAGLHDPEREILADLARHPELIPFPGVEGGTMRFYS